jgi:hypothetical protein
MQYITTNHHRTSKINQHPEDLGPREPIVVN